MNPTRWLAPVAHVLALAALAFPPASARANVSAPLVHVETASLTVTWTPGAPTAFLLAVAPADAPQLHTVQARSVAGEATLSPARLPLEPATLTEAGVMRGVRLMRLAIHPAFAEKGQARALTQLTVQVKLAEPVVASLAPGDPFYAALTRQIINPQRLVFAPRPAVPAPALTHSAPITAQIVVSQTGLTAITYAHLLSAGFPLTATNPISLQLSRAGQPVALEWEGDADALFEPGEQLLFYAQPRFSRWTVDDVYHLTVVAGAGLRMTSRAAAPTGLPAGVPTLTQTWEQNTFYTPQCYCGHIDAGRDGDRWVWDRLDFLDPNRRTRTYNLTVPAVQVSAPAALTVWLVGATDQPFFDIDHIVDVALNGARLGRISWDGRQAVTFTTALTPGILLSGANALSLTLPGGWDDLGIENVEVAWLDAFALTYGASAAAGLSDQVEFAGAASASAYTLTLAHVTGARAYDLTNPNQPQRLTGFTLSGNSLALGDTAPGPRRYALLNDSARRLPVAVRLAQTPANTPGAYLVITHADFVSALAPLLALRHSQGLTPTLTTLDPIYDTFGDGRVDPQAIRAYLHHVYTAWPAPPTYVLLVGDGTFDPKRYRASAKTTYLPAYLAVFDLVMGETAADNRYVTVDGADNLPDMLVGRLPVNTLAEAHTVVSKTVAYETAPAPGVWPATALVVADNPDGGGDFHSKGNSLRRDYLFAPFHAPNLYYAGNPATLPAFRHSLTTTLNTGPGMLIYLGHSWLTFWAQEMFFGVADVPALTNGARLPLALQFTCFTGSFHDPTLDTLDESLVRHPTGGAVAAWGSTGLNVAVGHQQLAQGFLDSLARQRNPEVGAGVLAGKLQVAALGDAPDLLDAFTWLGDPALRYPLDSLPDQFLYLPVIRR